MLRIQSSFVLVGVMAVMGWAKIGQAADGHAHPTVGPHKGTLVELGAEEFHAEVTHDDKAASVTIYLLGPDAKKLAVSEAQDLAINVKLHGKPMQMKLKAVPQMGDPAGKSSRFAGVSKDLVHALDHADSMPQLRVMIAGKTYVGKISASHDHNHDHDHGPATAPAKGTPRQAIRPGAKR